MPSNWYELTPLSLQQALQALPSAFAFSSAPQTSLALAFGSAFEDSDSDSQAAMLVLRRRQKKMLRRSTSPTSLGRPM